MNFLDDPGDARAHLDLAFRLDGPGCDDDPLDEAALDVGRGARIELFARTADQYGRADKPLEGEST